MQSSLIPQQLFLKQSLSNNRVNLLKETAYKFFVNRKFLETLEFCKRCLLQINNYKNGEDSSEKGAGGGGGEFLPFLSHDQKLMKIVDFLQLLKPLSADHKDKIDVESYFISIIMQAQFELDRKNGSSNNNNNNNKAAFSGENQPECLQILKSYYKDIVYAPPELQYLQISMLDYYSMDIEVQKHKAILKKHSVEWNERLQTMSLASTVKPQYKTLSQVIITNSLSSVSSNDSNSYPLSTQKFFTENQQQMIDRNERAFSNDGKDPFISSSSSSRYIAKSRYGTSNSNMQTMTSKKIQEEVGALQKVTFFMKKIYQKYAFMTPYVVLMFLSCTAVIISLKISSHSSSTKSTGKKTDDTWNQIIQLIKSTFGYP